MTSCTKTIVKLTIPRLWRIICSLFIAINRPPIWDVQPKPNLAKISKKLLYFSTCRIRFLTQSFYRFLANFLKRIVVKSGLWQMLLYKKKAYIKSFTSSGTRNQSKSYQKFNDFFNRFRRTVYGFKSQLTGFSKNCLFVIKLWLWSFYNSNVCKRRLLARNETSSRGPYPLGKQFALQKELLARSQKS